MTIEYIRPDDPRFAVIMDKVDKVDNLLVGHPNQEALTIISQVLVNQANGDADKLMFILQGLQLTTAIAFRQWLEDNAPTGVKH